MKVSNPKTTETLRKIHGMDATIHADLVDNWGTPLLGIIAAEFLSEARLANDKYSPDLVKLVVEASTLHQSEFSEFPEETPASKQDNLSQTPQIQLIEKKFPHIGRRLFSTWGTQDFARYIRILTAQKQGVKRQGFPADIMLVLFSLKNQHDSRHPEFCAQNRGLQWY